MKDVLIAGDTLDFTTSVPLYPPAAGWTLSYTLAPRAGGALIEFNAATEDDHYRVQVGPSVTTNWVAGEYNCAVSVSKAGERYTVERRIVTIDANITVFSGLDGRSHARKTLDAIEAVLEKRASQDQMSYTIGGRSLARTPIADLLVLRDKYRWEVFDQDAVEKIEAGLGNPRRLGVRFGGR